MSGVAVGLLAALLAAGVPAQQPLPEVNVPFWDVRGYNQWSVGETLTVLTDSPWSRPGTLLEPGMSSQSGPVRYYAQWYSAQTVREALVRQRHLKGGVDPSAEAEFLAGPRPAYQLYLFAAFFTENGSFRLVPLEALAGLSREELLEGARLIFSSQEHTARPDEVELITNPATQELVGLRLTFTRARQAVPLEEARQGQVKLVCPTRHGSLSVSFLLEEMRRQGRPDL